jgi:FixJ family two-component response regulator
MIAVVDDDAGLRAALQRLLRAAGFEVSTFASAEEFLDTRSHGSVHCLIADIHLPGMSGVALLKALAADAPAQAAVLITGRGDPATLELIRRAGPVPHLRKPFSGADLFDAIGRAVSV